MQRWPLNLRSSERKVYSQTMQDGVLEEIFLQLGTTNKYFVEFGFDANNYTMGVGANTQLLWEKGWRGLLMDGSHDNPDINLHQEFICPENIVSLFQKYNVPLEPDYVSIDIDSSDIWILLELTKVYKPRVITVEYNQNFPAGSTFAWPPGCTEHWLTDRVMGSSLGAIFLAAQDAGYKVVHVIDETDAFLVRNDIAACLEVLPQWVHEARCTSKPLHAIHADTARPNILIDYATFRATGDLEKARWKSRELVQFAPLLRYPNGFEVRPDGK